MIWGAPFLGAFDGRDVVGLIEIAANARAGKDLPRAAQRSVASKSCWKPIIGPATRLSSRVMSRTSLYAPWFLIDIMSGSLHDDHKGITISRPSGARCRRRYGRDSFASWRQSVSRHSSNPMLVRRGMKSVPEADGLVGSPTPCRSPRTRSTSYVATPPSIICVTRAQPRGDATRAYAPAVGWSQPVIPIVQVILERTTSFEIRPSS